MKAKDVMTSPVVSVEPDATVLQAIRIMLQRRVSGLPVIDENGRLLGIVTEGDFLRRAETGTVVRRARWLELLVGPSKLAQEYVRSHARKVHEVMTPDPVTVAEDTHLEDIVRMMEKHQIKRVPVVRGQEVKGIVSRANLLQALAIVAREAKPAEQSDEAIRAQLMAELGKHLWAPVGLINPVVRNGVVELWGTITHDRARQALVVAAENVPGVKAVRDHLTWIDATSGMAIYQSDEPSVEGKAS
jgi:CBS domain-containing protein